jgi:hypothetical protein
MKHFHVGGNYGNSNWFYDRNNIIDLFGVYRLNLNHRALAPKRLIRRREVICLSLLPNQTAYLKCLISIM